MRGTKEKQILGTSAPKSGKEVHAQSGITLIALIVSIIVMLILAGVSINAIVGDNGIITSAILASTESKYANYVEELSTTLIISGDTPTCVGEDLKNYISSMRDEDLENFMILKGELYYIGSSDSSEMTAASSVGIITDLSGGSATEVITIINSVIIIEDEDEYIGTKLLDKNAINSETWKLAIDYNNSNVEIARYGTGYYLLMPDTEYTINGETVTFSDYYVVDYENQALITSNNIIYWDINSTLAVSEGLVLNIDPTNMADVDYEEITVEDDAVAGEGVETTAYQLYVDEKDTGITMYGDVVYDDDTSALVFNESDDNPLITEDGDTAGGGYLKLVKDSEGNEIDFSNGFSFEIYANLSRLAYDNGEGNLTTEDVTGLFCRMPSLFSKYSNALRFAYTQTIGTDNYYLFAKFYGASSWYGNGNVAWTISNGTTVNPYTLEIGNDFYLTCVYVVYDDSKSNEYYDDIMASDNVDKLIYFIDGEEVGYTYYGKDSYNSGLSVWNTNECPFFVGVVPYGTTYNLYYLKGSVYSIHLYTTSMTEDEVLESYNTTLRYRNSFIN